MSCQHVCIPCCRRLTFDLKQVAGSQWIRRASHTTVNNAPSASAKAHNDGFKKIGQRHSSTASSKSPHRLGRDVPSLYDRSVEDDFLERLFESGDHPKIGPYSRTSRSRQLEQLHNGDEDFQNSQRDIDQDGHRTPGTLGDPHSRAFQNQEQKKSPSTIAPMSINSYSSRRSGSYIDIPSQNFKLNTLRTARSGRTNPNAEVVYIRHEDSLSTTPSSKTRKDTRRATEKSMKESGTRTGQIMVPLGSETTTQSTTNFNRRMKDVEDSKAPEFQNDCLEVSSTTSLEKSSVLGLEAIVLKDGLSSSDSYQMYLELTSRTSPTYSADELSKVDYGLLRKVTRAFLDTDDGSVKRPCPSEVIQHTSLPTPEFLDLWLETLWCILFSLTRLLNGQSQTSSLKSCEMYITEVANLWQQGLIRLVSPNVKPKISRSQSRVKFSSGWDVLNMSKEMSEIRAWSNKDFSIRLSQFSTLR